MPSFKIGTRGSPLALAQVQWVTDRLKALQPELKVERVVIKTSGDRVSERFDPNAPIPPSAPGILKGLFTKEIEESLLKKEIDAAVHSLKDLFPELAPGLVLAAFPEREDPRDCLISKAGLSLDDLPDNAVIGTSSLRRRSFLKHLKPSLRFVVLRGNVETRIKKMEEGACDALVVAYAGLKRLGLEKRATEIFEPEALLPAPGQGVLALEALSENKRALEILSKLDHAPTRVAVTAERTFLNTLEGGCQVPIGAHASLRDGVLELSGGVAGDERVVRGKLSGLPADAASLGQALAQGLLRSGADEILEQLKANG